MNMTTETANKIASMMGQMAVQADSDIGPLAETAVEEFEVGHAMYPGVKLTAEIMDGHDELVTTATYSAYITSTGKLITSLKCDEICIRQSCGMVQTIATILNTYSRLDANVRSMMTAIQQFA